MLFVFVTNGYNPMRSSEARFLTTVGKDAAFPKYLDISAHCSADPAARILSRLLLRPSGCGTTCRRISRSRMLSGQACRNRAKRR